MIKRNSKYRLVIKNKIFLFSFLGIITLLIWGLYLFISKDTHYLQDPKNILFSLILTKFIGLIASIFLILHEFKIHTYIGEKLCHLNSFTNCDKVLFSRASKIYGGVSWADAGLIFYTGTLLYLMGINESSSLGILAIISVMALPYTFFSFYFQSANKMWCPFCLIVQVIIITEFILLLPVFKNISFSLNDALLLVVNLLITSTIWFLLKTYRNTQSYSLKINQLYLNLKRNPDIIKFLLHSNKHENVLITSNNLILGNLEAPLTIMAFLNYYCYPCAIAFKHLIKIVEKNPEVNLRLVFSIYDEATEKLTNTIYYIYSEEGQNSSTQFLIKWFNTISPERISLEMHSELTMNYLASWSTSFPHGYKIAESVRKENSALFDEYNITATPLFYVNEFKYPQFFEIDDFEFYLDELKKLKKEIYHVK
jgi:uncharacterized membrane protein